MMWKQPMWVALLNPLLGAEGAAAGSRLKGRQTVAGAVGRTGAANKIS